MGFMTVFADVWKWFLGTTIGRWIVGIGAVALALSVALYVAFRKGKHAQATTDEAKDAAEQVQAAQDAQQTYQQATEAAAKVEADAKAAPPPDTVKRDDLDRKSVV